MGSDTLAPMTHIHRILQSLADGRFHSGAELGAELGISRTAVWKQMARVQALGLELHAVRGRGYRLSQPLELLDKATIAAHLPARARALLTGLDIHPQLESTNTYLRSALPAGGRSGYACLAERQTQGRGRRGRAWVSPFGANLYLSVGWRFSGSAANLGGLSLAVGVAAARALADAGVSELGLKWPNDLIWQQRKLGGVLLELAGEAHGPCDVVVGIGVNVSMPRSGGALVDQPWTDLRSILGDRCPSRNQLAAQLLGETLVSLAQYEQRGLEGFLGDWRQRDIVAGREVELQLPQQRLAGTALGVDESGALLVRMGASTRRFASGEVSLRVSA